MVMDSPSPQSVGREFVRQYYTMLHEAPDYLHRFYSHNSSFVHGGVDHTEEEQLPAVGQSEIHKKISSLKFRDCHAKIRQVDSQWSIGGSVVIQVVGELSNNGLPMRRFMQTFVLAQQTPKKFYVHNDIFRYQDDVFESGNDTELADEAGEAEGVDGEDEGLVSGAQEQETVELYYGEETDQIPSGNQVSNGNLREVEPKEAVKPEEVIETIEEVEQPKPTGGEELNAEPEVEPTKEVVEDGVQITEPFAKEDAGEVEAEGKSMPAEVEVSTAVPQKPTWAAMASKNMSSPAVVASAAASTGYVTKPQATIRPEMKAETTPPMLGLPKRVHGTPRAEAVPQDGYRGASDADESGRNMQQYPDNQQVFVGNLPRTLADKELREFFEKFGEVLDMRINRKPNNNNLPNFGFVVFDSPETVQRVLSERPLMFNGKHRVNVEEKKPREELVAARPRSATHIAGKPGPGTGRGGADATSAVGRGAGRQSTAPAAASGGQRNYLKGGTGAAVNDEGKTSGR